MRQKPKHRNPKAGRQRGKNVIYNPLERNVEDVLRNSIQHHGVIREI